MGIVTMALNSSPAARCPLPVTVLSGFTGAGKTALLDQLLHHRRGQRLAVIAPANHAPGCPLPAGSCRVHTAEKLVHLATEAGSYALRADLLLEAGQLARAGQFDGLLVENPGLAALQPVVRTFALGNPAYGLDLPQRTRLDSLVTVVDATRFLPDFRAPPDLPAATSGHPAPAPLRARAEVLAEQVEHANVLVLNQADQLAAAGCHRLRALLRHLNPTACLVETRRGEVPTADLLATVLAYPGVAGPAHQVPPAAGGISAQEFRDERPFHPARLWYFLHGGGAAGLLRAQGLCWLASRPEDVLSWQQAGPACRLAPAGTWWAAVPDRHQDPGFRRDAAALRARWHPQFQDRVNTLRFIGLDLDPARFRADLTACLCTPLEISRWRRGATFSDPWPQN